LREAFAGFDVQSNETSTHAWMHLPEPWRGGTFAQMARQRGVAVLPADVFAVGREMLAHAVRINVGAARSRVDLRRALHILVELMSGGHFSVLDGI
jgi:DNA-binding transcriptional MocR family regulator